MCYAIPAVNTNTLTYLLTYSEGVMRLPTVRNLLASSGKRKLAFLDCTLSGRSKISFDFCFCCIINITDWPDTPLLQPDRPALRRQLALARRLHFTHRTMNATD